MSIIIGAARINENNTIISGEAGDQKQNKTPDTEGEVSLCEFYPHKQGWYVMRPKKAEDANAIAIKMQTACNNVNIGYDQANRLDVVKKGVESKTKIGCDCSSLVRACIKEGAGKDPGNFLTYNATSVLESSGLFEPRKEYEDKMKLYTGDVLVTKTKGHAAIVTKGSSRE